MKLKKLGNNLSLLELSESEILISYQTPVAARIDGEGYIRTSKKHSVTTSKHVNQWLGDVNAKLVDQSELDKLMEG